MKTKEAVLLYEKKRYRKIDQKLIDRSEGKIVGKILARIGSQAGSLLDIPCGYGRFTPIFLERKLYLACSDLSPAMVARCKERAAAEVGRKKGSFVVSDIQHLPFKDNAFHCVFTFRLFQHIPTQQQRQNILCEISRVTRKWAIVSFYRKRIIHVLERKLIRRKTPIKMVVKERFFKEAAACNLSLRGVYSVVPLFHAQVIALLEKSTHSSP
jgi:ubiquinone/menaquinone biosynthesis C-methylase UbiE